MVDAGSLKSDNDPVNGPSLTRARQDDCEVSAVAGTIYLLILIAAFIGIVIWVFGRKRKARFEANARIPLDDDKGSPDGGKRG